MLQVRHLFIVFTELDYGMVEFSDCIPWSDIYLEQNQCFVVTNVNLKNTKLNEEKVKSIVAEKPVGYKWCIWI